MRAILQSPILGAQSVFPLWVILVSISVDACGLA